jgi:hypothetical protein
LCVEHALPFVPCANIAGALHRYSGCPDPEIYRYEEQQTTKSAFVETLSEHVLRHPALAGASAAQSGGCKLPSSNGSPFQNCVFMGSVMQHSRSDPNKVYIFESSNNPDLCKEVRKASLQRNSSAEGDQWLECTNPIRPHINEAVHFTVDPHAVYKALLIPTATPVPINDSTDDTASRRPAYRGRVRQHSKSGSTKFYIEELSKDPNLRQEVGDAREALGRLGSVKAIQWLEATAATAPERPEIGDEVEFVIDENDICKAIVTRRMHTEPDTTPSIQARTDGKSTEAEETQVLCTAQSTAGCADRLLLVAH